MSVKTCKQHANEPIFIYAQCAACEIQRYRNRVDELKAENESLRKDAQRYRWLRANNYYAHVQVMEVDGSMPYLYAEELDFGLDTAMGQGERS